METIVPFIRCFWTDIFSPLVSYQDNEKCAERELRVVDCLEAYGIINGKSKCRILIDDFHQCMLPLKQMRRTYIMRLERDRQVRDGERDPADKYCPAPPLDSYGQYSGVED